MQQASQRRATADRLLVEAAWLEALAADERTMAAQLADLPPSYAIMHDLRLPGSKGNIDHLVVGPGGAFVVLTRRCTEAITYHSGQLWAGDLPLRDTLDSAKVESQLLTQSLATPVVPIVALLGAMVPAATPNSVENVLVCAGDHVVRVVTRGAHTLLASHKIGEIAERALPMLHNAGSVVRTQSALGVHADPAPDASVRPVVPPVAPASPESQKRRAAMQRASQPRKERSGRTRSLLFIVGLIFSLCLVAVAVGNLARLAWSDYHDPGSVSAATSGVKPVTTAAASAGGPMAALLPAPKVEFFSTCPAPGAGWQLLPVWPGDLVGLVQYEIEIQSLDGTWSQLPPLATAHTPWDSLRAQPANSVYTVRITAATNNGKRSLNAPTVISTPPTTC